MNKLTYEELLEKLEKKEKLLELYKIVITEKDDMLDCCEVVDDDYYGIEELVTRLEKRILELENEINL